MVFGIGGVRVGAAACLLGIVVLLAGCGDDDGNGSFDGVRYSTLNYPPAAGGSTLLTGVRGIGGSSQVYISAIYELAGSATMNAALYKGLTSGGGTWYALAYPSSPGATVTSTAFYGPDDFDDGGISVVGNYTTAEVGNLPIGLLYQGPLDGSGSWRTLTPPQATTTIAHSNMDGFAVGNYETAAGGVGPGRAFVYDIASDTYSELVKPGAVSITAYGIWHNGGTSYTIAGGYAEIGLTAAYLVDWDSATQTASHWKTYRFKDQPQAITLLSHFEGITTDGAGGYNLAADSIVIENGVVLDAAFVNIPRNDDGTFGDATWTTISYPESSLTSANTVYQRDVMGIYQLGSDLSSGYVATVP